MASSHAVPSVAAGFEQLPVAGSQVPTTWQASLAEHATVFDPVQIPVRQSSDCVQAFPSLHAVPSGAYGFEQMPVVVLQVPATWQASLGAHTTVSGPIHAALWQVPVGVQASVHAVPSGAAGFEQIPVAGSHVPVSWHASLAVQMTGLEPVHAPETHASDWVHPLASLQVVPSGAAGFEQAPVVGSQVPAT